jgi:hypothetical protein
MSHEMVFDPTALRSLGFVFDEAWKCLIAQRPQCAGRPEVRQRLASMVLHLATDPGLGHEQIKAGAVRLLMREDADVGAAE